MSEVMEVEEVEVVGVKAGVSSEGGKSKETQQQQQQKNKKRRVVSVSDDESGSEGDGAARQKEEPPVKRKKKKARAGFVEKIFVRAREGWGGGFVGGRYLGHKCRLCVVLETQPQHIGASGPCWRFLCLRLERATYSGRWTGSPPSVVRSGKESGAVMVAAPRWVQLDISYFRLNSWISLVYL